MTLLHLAGCSSTNTGRVNPDTLSLHESNPMITRPMKSLPINTFAAGVTPFLIIVSCVVPTLHSNGASADSFLPEIIIRAESTESNNETSLAAWVTPQSDIQARNAVSVSEALEQVPGLNVQYGASSGEARAWIRGFRDRETLILYDGVPVASAYDGTIDLAELTSQGVAQIRVMKSAPSVIYGINGLSGVVDINPERIGDEAKTSVRLQAGTEGGRLYQMSTSRRHDVLGGTLHVSQQKHRDFALPDGMARKRRLNSDFERRNVRLRLTHDGDKIGQTSFLALHSSNNKGLPPELYTDDPNYERLDNATQRIFALNHQFTELPIAAKIFESSYRFRLNEYDSSSYESISDTEYAEARTRGIQVFGHFEADTTSRLTASLAATEEALVDTSTDNAKGNRSAYVNAAVEYQYLVSDRVQVAVGGILTQFEPDFAETNSSTAFNPQIALEWDINQQTLLRISAAERTRFPKLVELFDPRYGNPEVSEAKSHNLDITLNWSPSDVWDVSGALYAYDIKNLIEKPSRRSPYANVPAVDVKGGEFAASYRPSELWAVRVAGSVNRSEEILSSGSRRQLRSRPKTTLLLQSDLKPSPSTAITVTLANVSGLYDRDDSGLYREVETGWILDATAHYHFNNKTRSYFRIENATDALYEHKIGFPRPGRHLSLGISFDL